MNLFDAFSTHWNVIKRFTFALNADIGENKCSAIMVKSALYITNNIIKIWIATTNCQYVTKKFLIVKKKIQYIVWFFFNDIYIVKTLSIYCQYVVNICLEFSFVKSRELKAKREYVISDLPLNYSWYVNSVQEEW